MLSRVSRGEILTVTSDGTEVAELRPVSRRSPSTRLLIERRRLLPPVDTAALRSDIDDLLDASL